MTCIVGIKENGKVYLGADAISYEGPSFAIARKDAKVFQKGQYGFAFTHSFRMGEIIQYIWTPPIWRPDEIELDKFIREEFIDSLQKIFREKGFGKSSADEDKEGGTFLVAIAGRLFCVQGDYQVGEYLSDYYAEGIGYAYAFGSLYSTEGLEPEYRIQTALEAATKFAPAVLAPFTIIEVTNA